MKLGLKLSSILLAALACTAAEAADLYVSGGWITVPGPDAPAPAPLPFGLAISTPSPASARALAFFRENAAVLGLTLPSVQMSETGVMRGALLETHRFRKTWNGLEVVGGDSAVSLESGRVVLANADGTQLSGLTFIPKVTPAEARALAFSSYAGHAVLANGAVKEVLLTGPLASRTPRLAYAVTVNDSGSFASDVHHVDALTGAELLVTSNEQPLAAKRRVLSANGSPDDFGVVTDDDGDQKIDHEFSPLYGDDCAPPKSCGPASAGVLASALNAWINSGLVYDYYLAVHGRDSVDGAGLPLRSIVNFGGSQFKNAAWYRDRKVMLYGYGSDPVYNDFASALDVVAHEITHGVTASTAALAYAGQPGALNESYSDIFGKLVAFRNGVAQSDWKMGAGLFKDGHTVVRDLESPVVASVSALKYQGQDCNRFNDFCGVHENSGPPSLAAVGIAKRIGTDHFAKLYYLTLTQLLRSSSDFSEAKAQTIAACTTLFGAGSEDCKAVMEEFTAVGIL